MISWEVVDMGEYISLKYLVNEKIAHIHKYEIKKLSQYELTNGLSWFFLGNEYKSDDSYKSLEIVSDRIKKLAISEKKV